IVGRSHAPRDCEEERQQEPKPQRHATSLGVLREQAILRSDRSLGAELLADSTNLRLAPPQRLGAGMHRVVAEGELVRMLRRRTEYEPGFSLGDEVDRLLGRLESGDFDGENRRKA